MLASNEFLAFLLKTAVILYYKYGNERSRKTVRDSYDFVVVGGGSAGAIVAAKLSSNPSVKVLLIESGGSGSQITDIPYITEQLLANTNLSRKWSTTVQKSGFCGGKPCPVTVGRILGGGSTQNRLCYIRGHPQDFTDWTNLGSKGWTYDDVLPFMIELETYEDRTDRDVTRGTKGPIRVTGTQSSVLGMFRNRWNEAAKLAGYELGDYNGPRQNVFGDVQRNIGHGRRQSTDNAYLKPIMRKRKNLDVIMFSTVTRVLFDGRTAIGVEYSRNGKLFNVTASKEVILSAGVFGSAQILMLSGVGPKEQLTKFGIKLLVELPGVGQHLQDHQVVGANITVQGQFPPNSKVNQENFDLWKTKGEGILATIRDSSQGYLTSKYSVNSNDSQIWLLMAVIPDDEDTNRTILRSFVETARTYSSGYAELRSKNPFDNLIVNPGYLSSRKDRQNLIQGFKVMFKLMNSKPFQDIDAKLIINSKSRKCSKRFKLFSDAWLYCFILKNNFIVFRYSGTCKMGPVSDVMAVVDDKLRVHRVKNLRVIDASIMPQITRGSPNAPVMMIGLKGADIVGKRWHL